MKRFFLALITIALLANPIPSAIGTTSKTTSFQAEVWADNWFALYVNGKKVGEDSVPITTERSFNSEKIKFSATYPFSIGVLARDFTENASGLEYIGKPNQQIGDAGIIFQIRDLSSNKIVAVSNQNWKVLVLNKAPLNVECVKSTNPLLDCKSQVVATPKLWSTATFKDSKWAQATPFSKEEVGVKDGYFDIKWDVSASLIWSSDLKLDNAILLRKIVKAETSTASSVLNLQLFSPEFQNGGSLPKSATCDGGGVSPALSWSGLPSATKSLAIVMNTIPGPARPGETAALSHAYLVLYNIPPSAASISAGSKSIGTFGQNFQGKNLGYTPPCSQGPGAKKYTITLYALNQILDIAPEKASEDFLTVAMQGKIIEKSVLEGLYERS